MELHFCDLCNESVPQRDLDQGRAFLRKGRVICATCDVAMGGAGAEEIAAVTGGAADTALGDPALEAAAAETALGIEGALGGGPGATGTAGAGAAPVMSAGAGASTGSGLAMVLASMGILLTASVAVLLFERLHGAETTTLRQFGELRGELRAGLDDVRDEVVAGERARAEELGVVGANLAALTARVDEREKAGAQAAEALASDVAQIQTQLAETAALAERVAAQDQRAEEVAARITEMRGDIGLIAEKVLELEERPMMVAAPLEADPAQAPDPDEPEWMSLVVDLDSPSFNARYAAVTALGDTGDPAVVPYLVPMLGDQDLFVRMATARVLGDLGAPEAVPALIDALEDQEPSVREQAVVSLRSLTNKAFGYDPTGNQAERSKKIKAWRDWWRRNGDAFAGRA